MDYAVGAELSKTFVSVTPSVGVGYTMPGDPEAFELRNSLSARAGAAVQMARRVRGHVRSEERRVRKEWVSKCRSRWSLYLATSKKIQYDLADSGYTIVITIC